MTATTEAPVVELSSGRLVGRRLPGCEAWLGIPYAAPPVGPLRLQPPAPPVAWRGVREALAFGPACPQSMGLTTEASPPSHDEDCLSINVWAPKRDGRRRPVFVWIYGGAFISGAAKFYDGAHLASSGDIVVVTFNYRVGPLGFVNFGSLPGGEEIEGNLGLRDQIAALRWVRENIAEFGGDPERVTLAGQSAGGISVSLLMLCREAQPLFHGAIIQSGAPGLIHDRDMSEYVASLYERELGLKGNLADRLASFTPLQLLKAQQAVHKLVPGTLPAAPWFDGGLLPESLAAAREVPPMPIPLLAGWTRDEIRLFKFVPGPRFLPLKRDQVAGLLEDQLGENRAEAILGTYPPNRVGSRALATDATFAMSTLHVAERHARSQPTWVYRFDARHPLVGAVHAIELTYLWNFTGGVFALARGGPLIGRWAALAQRMRQHWIQFVRDGQPGEDWPPFNLESRATKILSWDDSVVCDPNPERRDAWAGQDIMAGGTRGRNSQPDQKK